MDNSDKGMPPKNKDIYDQFYDFTSVESNTEMTGLTPANPPSEYDESSYSDLQGMPVSKHENGKKTGKSN